MPGVWQPVTVHPLLKVTATALAGTAVAGAACLAYAAGYEVRAYRLRRFDIPVLAPGEAGFRFTPAAG